MATNWVTSRKENFVNQLEGKIKERLASEAKLPALEQATEMQAGGGWGGEKEAGSLGVLPTFP